MYRDTTQRSVSDDRSAFVLEVHGMQKETTHISGAYLGLTEQHSI